MKGNNTLVLNQETMCEALQVWLDLTLVSGHKTKVTNVAAKSGSYGSDGFEVTVSTQEGSPS